jgi:hypothetical protein
MPQIAEIKEYLVARLAQEVREEAAFREWVDNLFKDTLGQVLGVNLYIDLFHESLEQSLVASIIDGMSPSGGDARERFYACVEDEGFQPGCICMHKRGTQLLAGDRYVRILPLDLGIQYYFRHALSLASSGHEAESEVLEEFFNPVKEERRGLGLVREIWRGRMMNVWVTSKAQLDDVRAATDEDEFANVVRDYLGFEELDEGVLVGIVYPVDFAADDVRIPTTLDAHSGCHFFVSFASVGAEWGLTCCLNGGHDHAPPPRSGFKERVHRPFVGLTDAFESEMIGKVTEEPEPDWAYLLGVALDRAS